MKNSGDEKLAKIGVKILFSSFQIFIFSFFLRVMLPSPKTLSALILLPKLEHSQFAKEAAKLPTNTLKLLNEWVEQMIKEKAK